MNHRFISTRKLSPNNLVIRIPIIDNLEYKIGWICKYLAIVNVAQCKCSKDAKYVERVCEKIKNKLPVTG